MQRKHLCPYCQFDMTLPLVEITHLAAKEGRGEDSVTLCISCGEPIFTRGKWGWRKPTWNEMQQLVEDANYHDARAGYIELKRRVENGNVTPVETQWLEFRSTYVANVDNAEHLEQIKRIYFLAFAQCMRLLGEASGMDDGGKSMVTLIKAELNAFYETMREDDENVRTSGKGTGETHG